MLKPRAGQVTPAIVKDALLLIGLRSTHVSHWGRERLAVAYDYAMREHLAASDVAIKRVKRPVWLR